MKARFLPFNVLVLAAIIFGPRAGAYAAIPIPPPSGCQTFPQTGQSVCGSFLQYWQTHGGLAQQGYPISGEFSEVSDVDGKSYTVQYFERAVFESHPENQPPYDVLLSLLGTITYKQRYPNGGPLLPVALPPEMLPEQSVTFPQTGMLVPGLFYDYWQTHGGVMQQGYPISGPMLEKSALDGKQYIVQYFERAEFEYHPENQPPYNVLLSQLGRLQNERRYPSGGSGGTLLAQGIWGGQNLNMTVTATGATLDFSCAHGTVDQPIALDTSGHFSARGTYVFEHGGPVKPDEQQDSHPALYTGVTDGRTLTITVNVIDTNQTLGTFTLQYGQQGKVVKCLAP